MGLVTLKLGFTHQLDFGLDRLGQYRTNLSMSDWRGLNRLTSLEKLVIGITKSVLEYDIEY